MSLLHNRIDLFFAVETPTPSGGSKIIGTESSTETYDLLKDDPDDKAEVIDLEDKKPAKVKEEEKEIEAKPEKEDEETDEDKELKALEEELEEDENGPDEDKLELVTPVRRKEILAKFPTLFKDFPYLEKAYYREQQFTELFPTIDDAKSAKSDTETISQLETELNDGNIETILSSVKKENPKAFARVADNYLTTLQKVDNQAYLHVVGNTVKHVIMDMVSESRANENKALETAATILHQFVFASSKFVPPSKLEIEEKPEDKSKEKDIERREKEFNERQLTGAKSGLNDKIQNAIKRTIEENMDPKKSMTDYIRKGATRDAYETVERLIKNDSRFKALVDRLWQSASKDNFSEESTKRIKAAYNSKARTLLPSVIKKARIEALRGMGKRVKDEEPETEQETAPERKSPRAHVEPKKPVGKVSTFDYLNQD